MFVSDGEMQMTRHDTVLVVITGGFTDKFKDLGSEVLKNSRLPLPNLQYITTHLHKYRHVEHSCPPSKDGGYNRQDWRPPLDEQDWDLKLPPVMYGIRTMTRLVCALAKSGEGSTSKISECVKIVET